MGVLYRPEVGAIADVIPFCRDGVFHLFYLHDHRDPARFGPGVPWRLLQTRDFVHFEDHGVVIPTGPVGSQDQWIFTGCVVEHAGRFHIFYTGHNHHLPPVGRPAEAIMHAVSDDLVNWQKDESFAPLFAPPGYERDDWRDPFVLWNAEEQCWWMLLAARTTAQPSNPRPSGVTALLTSNDLMHWQLRQPLYAPNLFYTHECPDLFRIGDWWYLVFSEFSDRHTTRYRMSRSIRGPWLAPPDDELDTPAFYAAKTAQRDGERFLFGWLASRENCSDSGKWQWGGDLVVHQIIQQPDGRLTVTMPQSIAASFGQIRPVQPRPVLGHWEFSGDAIRGGRVDGRSVLVLGELPDTCLIDMQLTLEAATREAGIALRADPEKHGRWHEIRIEPHKNRIVLDRRSPHSRTRPFDLERHCRLQPGAPIHLRIVVDGTCVVVYVNNAVAMSGRAYESFGTGWGLFVNEGSARCELSLRTR